MTYKGVVRKKKAFPIVAILIYSLVTVFLCGCSSGDSAEGIFGTGPVPFSEATWSDSADDIVELYGEWNETYESTYGGPCYVYTGTEYNGLTGEARYFFDGAGVLSCIEFSVTFSSEEEANSAYSEEVEQLEEKYGESDVQMSEYINGEVWYRDEGNIGISSVSVPLASMYILQIQYVNGTIDGTDTVTTQ